MTHKELIARLPALRKICDAATQPPWETFPSAGTDAAGKPATWPSLARRITAGAEGDRDDGWEHITDLDDCIEQRNLAFLIEARAALPACLDAIDRLRAALREAADYIDSAAEVIEEYDRDDIDGETAAARAKANEWRALAGPQDGE